MAILILDALAPAPPPIAMELSEAVPFSCEAAIAMGLIASIQKTVSATAVAPDVFKPRLRCRAGPLLVFLLASSEATTQQHIDVFQTTENILFINELASRQPPEHASSMA
ncbi:hypothetical protein NYP20_19350 [Pseudomonas sp. N3-W]|nr:hypothetical protein [Pseudomonas sp. N3-W]UWF47483.1 hypothetical protein NYP20_19350 [Pseudomonas sp. N3-W]